MSTTDKGGSITFSYNASGERIKAQYTENIVTTKYDSWGRKSEFNDPSMDCINMNITYWVPLKQPSPEPSQELLLLE
ncbi:hypothetical protein [Chryseobacterium sp.]|uniref:hypothetical protein n=1 Tax=Chryseobacterium sp. TaxID=1871047 RepID=UPI0024E1FEFB|nr:hypothetical protein [Chryseobacterium sp.]